MHYKRLTVHGAVEIDNPRRPRGSGTINKQGYIAIGVGGKFTYEHIVKAEKALGKPLPKGTEVHHVDGNPSNNENTNLVICPTHEYHFLLDVRLRAYNACGNANYRKCNYCKQWDDPKNMKLGNNGGACHLKCAAEYARNSRIAKGWKPQEGRKRKKTKYNY